MTKRISFESKSGGKVEGELAEPAGAGKVPCVVLIQEYWGVNDHVRSIADRLAKEGFLVLAPDLYHGQVTKDATEAASLMTKLDTMKAMGEIAGAANALRAHERSNGKVGVVGFCMGGALTLGAACHVEGLSAVVPFYGVPPADKVDYTKVTAPVLAHFAKTDEWASVDKAEAIKKTITESGGSMRLEVYDASHAFFNDTRPEVYAPECAKLAWERTIAFFNEHLR